VTRKVGSGSYRIQVIDRAIGVLDVLADDHGPVTLAELARRVGLAKSSVVRILAVLEQHRMVERNEPRGTYQLGMKLFELGSRALAQFDLERRAAAGLERLVAAVGETAYLSVLDGGEMMVVARAESPRAVHAPATIGRRHPVNGSAVGKALLAFLGEAEVRAVIGQAKIPARTRNTITTMKALLEDLRVTRDRGWALDDEEVEEGLRCVAAPIFDRSGVVIAAIGILSPAFRMPYDRIAGVAAQVVKEARALSAESGYAGIDSDSVNDVGLGTRGATGAAIEANRTV